MANKNYKIKKSGWAVTPIWWGLIVLVLAPVAVVVLMETGIFDVAEYLVVAKIVSMDYKTLHTILFFGLLLLAFLILDVILWKVWAAKLVYYEIQNRMLVEKRARLLFLGKDEVCKTVFLPAGMVVGIRQGLKGFLFNYGDVIISMGVGGDSQIVLRGVKRPRKVKKLLTEKFNNSGNTMFFNATF